MPRRDGGPRAAVLRHGECWPIVDVPVAAWAAICHDGASMTTSPAPERKRPLVLVAEDEESVRSMLAVALRASGFDAVLCEDGLDAAERLESGLEVDAALVDVRMPRLGGVEFLKRLRAREGDLALPVVAMSAYNDEVQEREVRAAGANAFLPKPFTITALRETLTLLLTP
jgi:CheY-like chemotaxis protein